MKKVNLELSGASYNPHFIFRNNHFNTVYRTFFNIHEINYKRERLETTDNDFIDLDFSRVNSNKIAVLIHGLEGSSDSNYIKSLTSVLNSRSHDVVVINLRGCSGVPNRLLSSYHSGKTDDLKEIISYIESTYRYKQINIIGFSLGGNIILKYLGESGNDIPSKINSAVTISVPCDLKNSSLALAKFSNKPYMLRFLRTLKKKACDKLMKFPHAPIVKENILKATNFYEFDNAFTAPVHGFESATDYWKKSSSKQFIPNIKIPTLLITSIDDPFLEKPCFPTKETEKNKYFNLELARYGGHVGFNTNFGMKNELWLENRITDFIEK